MCLQDSIVATTVNLHLWKFKIQLRKNVEIPALFLYWSDNTWNVGGSSLSKAFEWTFRNQVLYVLFDGESEGTIAGPSNVYFYTPGKLQVGIKI